MLISKLMYDCCVVLCMTTDDSCSCAGQSTCYSDCVARNRYRHEFLLFFDVDEVVLVNPGGPASSLEAFLRAEMAEEASVLSVKRYILML